MEIKEAEAQTAGNMPKKDVTLFFEVLKNKTGDLIKLNILFLLSGLLIVSLPAACCANCKLLIMMIEAKPYSLYQEFFKAFKKYFISSFFGTVGILFVLSLCGFTNSLYAIYFGESIFGLILIIIGLLLGVLLIIMLGNFWVLVALEELSFIDTIKEAWFLAIVKFPKNLFNFILIIMVIILHLMAWPFSLLLGLFITISLLLLLVTINTYCNFSELMVSQKER
jgi:uncharacterized membrane protein YesL